MVTDGTKFVEYDLYLFVGAEYVALRGEACRVPPHQLLQRDATDVATYHLEEAARAPAEAVTRLPTTRLHVELAAAIEASEAPASGRCEHHAATIAPIPAGWTIEVDPSSGA